MSHRSFARSATRKGAALALLASAALYAGSPLVAISSASSGGNQSPVSADFGDCKNTNSGQHLGYVCPTDPGTGSSTNSATGPSTDSASGSSPDSGSGSSTDAGSASSTNAGSGSSPDAVTGATVLFLT